jgi:hypothetical protein
MHKINVTLGRHIMHDLVRRQSENPTPVASEPATLSFEFTPPAATATGPSAELAFDKDWSKTTLIPPSNRIAELIVAQIFP